MSLLAPHLLLFADSRAPQTTSLLRAADYKVSRVELAAADQLAGRPDVDAIVVQLSALAAVAVVRRIESCRRDVKIVVVSSEYDAVRRAVPSVRVVVIPPEDAGGDLVSTVDLMLVAHQMRRTG
jgi:hypothetical protein